MLLQQFCYALPDIVQPLIGMVHVFVKVMFKKPILARHLSKNVLYPNSIVKMIKVFVFVPHHEGLPDSLRAEVIILTSHSISL